MLYSYIHFKVKSDALIELEKSIENVNGEIAYIQEGLEIHVDLKDAMRLNEQLAEAKEQKKKLEEDIKAQVKIDAQEAQERLLALEKLERDIERDISMTMNTSGINAAIAEMESLEKQTESATAQLKEQEAQNKKLESSYKSLTVAAGAVFAGFVLGAKNALSAYAELSGAQSRLHNAMSLTMNATASQTAEIIALTRELEKNGVISAANQQIGAQELATFASKTESLKALIPVLNDVTAQQYGYAASGESVRNIATMIGKVLAGETGALSRYGYIFDDNQEKVLKFGQEEQKVATIIDIVTKSVGGTNEALAKTDTGKIASFGTEAQRTSEAIGGSLTPAMAFFSGILSAVVSVVADFIEKHKGLTAATVTFGTVLAGVVAILSTAKVVSVAYAAATTTATAATGGLTAATGALGAALTALMAHPVILLATAITAGLAAVLVGIVTMVKSYKEKQDELNKSIAEYNALKIAETTVDNIAAKEAEIKRLEELRKKYEEFINLYKKFNDSQEYDPELHKSYETTREDIMKLSDEFKKYGVNVKEYNEETLEFIDQTDKLTAELEALKSGVAAFTAQEDFAAVLTRAAESADKAVESLSRLDSALQKLSSGQSLDSAELLELCRLYPELAKYIRETGDAAFNNGELLKKLHESEKESAIEQIATAKARAQAELDSANITVAAEESKLAAMLAAGSANQAWLDAYNAKKAALESEKAKVDELRL